MKARTPRGGHGECGLSLPGYFRPNELEQCGHHWSDKTDGDESDDGDECRQQAVFDHVLAGLIADPMPDADHEALRTGFELCVATLLGFEVFLLARIAASEVRKTEHNSDGDENHVDGHTASLSEPFVANGSYSELLTTLRQSTEQLEHAGRQDDDEQLGENTEYQREQELDGRLAGPLLGALAAPRPE
jgi:hypothetical protein